MTLPRLMRRSAVAASFALAAASTAFTQPPPPFVAPPTGMPAPPDKPDPSVPVPQFEVVSVKPHSDANSSTMTAAGPVMRMMVGIRNTPDGFSGQNVTAHMLLTNGFSVNDNQILNEPDWAKSQRYDVEAKVAGPDVDTLKKLTRDQRSSMLQQVLTDRFKLVYHREDRELPVYNLVVGKGGPKLTESKPGPGGPTAPTNQMRISGDRVNMNLKGSTMADLAKTLTMQTGRTVIDKTGLTGHYDIALEFAPESGGQFVLRPSGADPDAADAAPSIFTAIQDLGLKLDATKGPASVVIIDHIEKPEEN